MSEQDNKQSWRDFLTTVPGLLTGCATLLTATAALIGVLITLVNSGLLSPQAAPTDTPTSTPDPNAVAETLTPTVDPNADVIVITKTPTPDPEASGPTPTPATNRLLTLADDDTPVPGLVTSWQTTEDALNWTLTLRRGVQLEDGRPWDSALAKETIDAGAGVFPSYQETRIIDDYTIQIILTQPIPSFIERLTQIRIRTE
jgi:ABC-type transport system substrate-binding protein